MAFRDARRSPAGTVEADLAIVGAGAAGIALARELAGHRVRVAVLESGDFSHRHRTQFLYRGQNVGRTNISTAFSRFRRFGGSTTRWGGQCRPFDPIDFEARPGVPLSGWPLGYADLEPYYRRAQPFLNLGRFDYEVRNWGGEAGGPLPLDSDLLHTRVYQFSHPTDLGTVYRAELEAAASVEIYLNANVVEILCDNGPARVTRLRVATLSGRCFEVRAKLYVLACGGIENARLLLASTRTCPNGLGNDHDLVGRYFMDHPYFFPGYYRPSRPEFDRNFYVIDGYEQTGVVQKMHAAWGLSERILREEGLNGCAAYLVRRPRYKATAAYFSPGGRAFNHLVEILQHKELPDGRLCRSLRAIATDSRNVLRTARDRLTGVLAPDDTLAMRVAVESTPCRDSRVTLGPRADRLGVPRVRVDWRVNESDKRGYERLMQTLRAEFHRLGLGQLIEHNQYDADGWPSSMIGGKHHMGTTRMAVAPSAGVVDPHCRVHGLENLYIAGSSVFPTGGYANPTLTLVALAIRLADRLKRLLEQRPA